MTSIAIYVEGGGDSANGKAQMRLGFNSLLSPQKEAARTRRIEWKIVLCGGRSRVFKAFECATKTRASDIVVLLVDAEGPVAMPTPAGRVDHLAKRDRWDFTGVTVEHVHLMTQCMEAWVVADAHVLSEYYGQGFNTKALPKRKVLDDEPKASVCAALEAATKNTKKGSYAKIKHASELLQRLRPTVIAARCTSFQQFTQWLDTAIAGA